jgi:hypothetical protein
MAGKCRSNEAARPCSRRDEETIAARLRTDHPALPRAG